MAGLLNRAEWMEHPFCLKEGFVRLFCGFEVPKPFRFPIGAYLGIPAITVRSPHGPSKSRFRISTRLSKILHIFSVRGFSKILNPVVVSVAVDVINAMLRPRSIKVQPSKSVRIVDMTTPSDLDSFACSGLIPCYITRLKFFRIWVLPFEKPSLWGVVKNLPNFFRCNVSFAHMAPIIYWSSIKRAWPGADESPVRPLKLGQVGPQFTTEAEKWAC